MNAVFSFETTYDAAATRALTRAFSVRPAKKVRYVYGAVNALCLLLIGVQCYMLLCNDVPLFQDPWLLILFVLVLLSAVCQNLTSAYRLSDAQLDKRMKKVKIEEERVRLEFGEEELLSSTDGWEEATRYAAITRLAICDGYYLLFEAPAIAHVLDKKVIPEPELFPFEQFMQKKTGLTWERLDA